MQTADNEAIQMHYTRADLGDVILAALEKAGKDVHRLTPEDLAPIEEFHITKSIGYRKSQSLVWRIKRGVP